MRSQKQAADCSGRCDCLGSCSADRSVTCLSWCACYRFSMTALRSLCTRWSRTGIFGRQFRPSVSQFVSWNCHSPPLDSKGCLWQVSSLLKWLRSLNWVKLSLNLHLVQMQHIKLQTTSKFLLQNSWCCLVGASIAAQSELSLSLLPKLCQFSGFSYSVFSSSSAFVMRLTSNFTDTMSQQSFSSFSRVLIIVNMVGKYKGAATLLPRVIFIFLKGVRHQEMNRENIKSILMDCQIQFSLLRSFLNYTSRKSASVW